MFGRRPCCGLAAYSVQPATRRPSRSASSRRRWPASGRAGFAVEAGASTERVHQPRLARACSHTALRAAGVKRCCSPDCSGWRARPPAHRRAPPGRPPRSRPRSGSRRRPHRALECPERRCATSAAKRPGQQAAVLAQARRRGPRPSARQSLGGRSGPRPPAHGIRLGRSAHPVGRPALVGLVGAARHRPPCWCRDNAQH